MSRLTQDGTAEPVSRETRFSGASGDREIFSFPDQLTTSRIGNLTWSILLLLYAMTIHTYTCKATVPQVKFHQSRRSSKKIKTKKYLVKDIIII